MTRSPHSFQVCTSARFRSAGLLATVSLIASALHLVFEPSSSFFRLREVQQNKQQPLADVDEAAAIGTKIATPTGHDNAKGGGNSTTAWSTNTSKTAVLLEEQPASRLDENMNVTTELTESFSTLQKVDGTEKGIETAHVLQEQGWNRGHFKNLTDEWLRRCAETVRAEGGVMRPFEYDQNFSGYRLGDCIRRCVACPSDDRGGLTDCIASEYRRRGGCVPGCDPPASFCTPTVKDGNLTLVLEILRDYRLRRRADVPDPNDELVVHLRLGDMVENARSSAETMLTEGATPAAHRSNKHTIKSAYEHLDNIRQSGCRKVTFIGGSHHPTMYEKSRVYSECVFRAMRHATDPNRFDVTLRTDGSDADRDFFYMAHAKTFVTSSGGYSTLIGRLVLLQGGKILGRTNAKLP